MHYLDRHTAPAERRVHPQTTAKSSVSCFGLVDLRIVMCFPTQRLCLKRVRELLGDTLERVLCRRSVAD